MLVERDPPSSCRKAGTSFTVFQLMTILEEARHSMIVIEHDPILYEDAKG
jgi:hypothetical protein